MKKNIILLIISIAFIILLICSLVVYAGSLKQNITIEEKALQELQYISNQLITILGQFNGLSIGDYALQLNAQKVSPEEQSNSNETEQETAQSQQGNSSSEKSGGTSNSSMSGNSENSNSSGSSNMIKDNQPHQVNQGQNQILAQDGKYTANWNYIKLQVENLYQVWNTASLDFVSLNIDRNLIISFTDYLNTATQNIKKKDKQKSITAIMNLYQLLPQYAKSFWGEEKQETIIFDIKANVITAYTNVSNEDWTQATNALNQSEQKFSMFLSSVPIDYKNQTTINQSYIIINELKKAVDLKDKEIFFIQYKNFISRMQLFV